MKKGILNEVNEIRRMMGLVSEQNDSIMDMLSSAFDKMNLGGVIDSIGNFDIDGIIDAVNKLDYDTIYEELSKLPKPVAEKLLDYIIEYVDKVSIPGIVGIVDKKQLMDIKNKLMSVWNESSINEQSDIKPSAQKSVFPNNDEILNKLPNTPDGGKKVTPDFGSADVIYPNGKTKSGKCWCSTKDGVVVAGCDGIENHCKGATYLPNRI